MYTIVYKHVYKYVYEHRLEDEDMEGMLESCGANSFFTLVRQNMI